MKTELQIKYERTVEEKEAGPLSQMDNLEAMKRMETMEAQLRRKTRKERGKMGLRREHVLAVVHSNYTRTQMRRR